MWEIGIVVTGWCWSLVLQHLWWLVWHVGVSFESVVVGDYGLVGLHEQIICVNRVGVGLWRL